MKVKLLSRFRLCDPMGYSLSGSSVHQIFQARVLEWVAVSFSRGSSQPRDLNRVSCIAGRGFYHLDFPGPSGKSKRENYHVKVKVTSDSLRPHGLYSPWSPWNSPGQNTGVGSFSLLQGIFPTQGYNPGLPHCRRILYQLSHKRSPRILEWVAYPFSSGSFRPSNQTKLSCIAGRFFTN